MVKDDVDAKDAKPRTRTMIVTPNENEKQNERL